MPQPDPVQPRPLTLQATPVFELPVTVAVNCCVFPEITWALVGETFMTMAGRMVTVADADLVVSALEVAVTVTIAGVGAVAGAV